MKYCVIPEEIGTEVLRRVCKHGVRELTMWTSFGANAMAALAELLYAIFFFEGVMHPSRLEAH